MTSLFVLFQKTTDCNFLWLVIQPHTNENFMSTKGSSELLFSSFKYGNLLARQHR